MFIPQSLRLLWLMRCCQAQVLWLFPDANRTFNYNDVIIAQWITNFTNPYLNVWAPNSINTTILNWLHASVASGTTYGYSFAGASSYFFPFESSFEINDGSTNFTNGVYDVSFTVTSTVGPPTTYGFGTTGVSTSTSSTATSKSVPTTTHHMVSTTRPSTPPPTMTSSSNVNVTIVYGSNPSLSTGAKAGIGVSVALVFSAICLAVACLFSRSRAHKRRSTQLQFPEKMKYSSDRIDSPELTRIATDDSSREHDVDSPETQSTPNELDGCEAVLLRPDTYRPLELRTQHELDAWDTMVRELESPVQTSELSANRYKI